MKFAVIALLLAAAIGVSASQHVLFTRDHAPAEWSMQQRAAPTAEIEFSIALKQRNLDVLDKWFHESSDPSHQNYQNFKTIDEINSLVAPEAKEVKKVMKWLKMNGVHHKNVESFGDSLDIKTTVKAAEKLFNTKFHTYRHTKTGAKVIRQFGDYSVPSFLKKQIEMVTGISTFPVPHLSIQRDNAANDYGALPQTAASQYSVTANQKAKFAHLSKKHAKKSHNKAAVSNSQAVIEFSAQCYDPNDLYMFSETTGLSITNLTANHIIGPNTPNATGTESTLDIEMITGINEATTSWFWLENGNGWLYQFATHFFNTEDVPLINSISYGWWEGDQCDPQIDAPTCSQLGVDSTGYVKRVNTEFQKIGARGLTLIAASGDSGANGRTNPTCTYNQLRPSFPGSSPWITSVGATELINTTLMTTQEPLCGEVGLSCALNGYEQAVSYALSQFASGGGFSNITTRPSYQDAAVTKYLASTAIAQPPASYFNAAGRGHPDVAAMGHNLLIVQGEQPNAVGGTSAAAPLFAGIIAMLNAEQIELTGKPLGFLNPFLYQMAAAQPNTFNDITVGDNTCTEQGCIPGTCEGFYATVGWDAVTGLGSPNYTNMLAYLKNHSAKRHRKH